jgi:hypothetical protein
VRRGARRRAVRVPAHVRAAHEVARRGAGRVRAVPRVVRGRGRAVHRRRAAERASAHQLVVAPRPELARALPPPRRRPHPRVVEGRVAGQDPRVHEPDHDAAAEPGPPPEAVPREAEAQVPRRVGGRQGQELLRVQPQAAVLGPQRLRLLVAQPGGEPVQHVAVRVDDPRAAVVPRGVRQERQVPLLERGDAVIRRRREVHDVVLAALLRVAGGEERRGKQGKEEAPHHQRRIDLNGRVAWPEAAGECRGLCRRVGWMGTGDEQYTVEAGERDWRIESEFDDA